MFVDLDERSPKRHPMATIELQVEEDDEPSLITSIKEVDYGSPRSIEFSPEAAVPSRMGYPTAHYTISDTPSYPTHRMEDGDMEELVSQLQYALTSERDENIRLRGELDQAGRSVRQVDTFTRATQTVGTESSKDAKRIEELEAEVGTLKAMNRTAEEVARSNYTAAVEWEGVYGTLAKEHADLKVLLTEYRSVLDRLGVPTSLPPVMHDNVVLSEGRAQRLKEGHTLAYPH